MKWAYIMRPLHKNRPLQKIKWPLKDYLYNYHSAKLTFGLILMMEFNDAVREGDGDRLFDLYKIALLLYKANNNYKYTYVVLLHLVKRICFLSEKQAYSAKWNRFFNGNSKQGGNIPLDLKKEQQNRILKSMWRGLGPNLDEANAGKSCWNSRGCREYL